VGSFINDEQIKGRCNSFPLFCDLLSSQHLYRADASKLRTSTLVVKVFEESTDVFGVKNLKILIEPSLEFHPPFDAKRGRTSNQNPIQGFRMPSSQLHQDEPGLNRLPQTHFIRDQDSLFWRVQEL